MKDGWRTGTISDIAEVSPKISKSNITDETLVSFIPMASVSESGKVIEMQVKKYSDVKTGFPSFENGDVLFAKITPCMENGKGALVHNLTNGIGFGSTEFFVLRTKESACSDFLYQLTISKMFRHKALAYLKGTAGQQRVSRDIFTMLNIPIPPLPEQKRIAEILTAADSAIEEAGRAVAESERVKQGLMQMLIPDDAEELKDRWNTSKIKEIFDVKSGTTPSTKEEKYWKNGDVIWVTPADLSGIDEHLYVENSNKKVTNIALRETGLYLVPKDTIIISTRAPVGTLALANSELTFNQGCKGLLNKDTRHYNTKFYYYYLLQNTQELQNQSGGSTFKELSKERLGSFPVPLPPITEQKRIAEILKTADEKIALCKERKTLLEKIKLGLMNELLGN